MKAFFNRYITTNLKFNIFILYRKYKSINKRYYMDDFVQVMNLKIILFMHFSRLLVPHMQVVIYP